MGHCGFPEVEPNDAGVDGQVVHGGETILGSISTEGDVDYYAVDLMAGQTLTVDLSGCTDNTVVYVYGSPLPEPLPDEVGCAPDDPAPALACDDDSGGGVGCSRLQLQAPRDGVYYLRVIPRAGFGTVDYPLSLTIE